MAQPGPYLTTEELLEFFKISKSHFYNLHRKTPFPHIRLGILYRWDLNGCIALFEEAAKNAQKKR